MGKIMMRRSFVIFTAPVLLTFSFSSTALPTPGVPVTFTVLHTNDFHGQLESSGDNPGSARVAALVDSVRAEVGPSKVLLADAGDEMQGSLLSNIGDGQPSGKGLPTIASFNAIGYSVATFGNHEFDWGQANLSSRTTQATYPFVTANIVQNDTGNCATAGWSKPPFAAAPYRIFTVGAPPNALKVAFIGVTTTEAPAIIVQSATAGLCFKDPAQSILHYYDAMKGEGAEVIVVLSHLGLEDGGYGYGIQVYGDKTLADRLNKEGKPADLIIGGHSHTDMQSAAVIGKTTIGQAYFSGRRIGRADVSVGPDGGVRVAWSSMRVPVDGAKNPTVDGLVNSFASSPGYTALVNAPVGYSAVDLPRLGGRADNMMGNFIDDAVYGFLNSDSEPANDVDIVMNNAGGIRTEWCYNGNRWVNSGCTSGMHAPALLNYGQIYTILPFGNSTVVGRMTGERILEVLGHGPYDPKGVIQPSGLRYSYFQESSPDGETKAWWVSDVTVYDRTNNNWEPLELKKSYRVGTNEFLAPAGGDGYSGFKAMTGVTYWGDMLNQVNSYISSHYGSIDSAYRGPNGDGSLDSRIRSGNPADSLKTVPLKMLHQAN
jgi:2',3'-cyclic-nucleotide 2'-phosphodiesterase (5'-nucleotidase family)